MGKSAGKGALEEPGGMKFGKKHFPCHLHFHLSATPAVPRGSDSVSCRRSSTKRPLHGSGVPAGDTPVDRGAASGIERFREFNLCSLSSLNGCCSLLTILKIIYIFKYMCVYLYF